MVDITREGVWKNPVLLKILSQQPVETEEGKRVIFKDGMLLLKQLLGEVLVGIQWFEVRTELYFKLGCAVVFVY